MFTFPKIMPEVEVTRLDEEPFAVECRELRWWFIVPEVGQRRHWATYDYPGRNLTDTRFLEGVMNTRVHDHECCEIRLHWTNVQGPFRREAYAYAALQEGFSRWYAWWNLDDYHKLYTCKDESFGVDWGASPMRIADAGRYRWVDDARLETADAPWGDPLTDPTGAGLCRVRIGEKEYRCLRVIEVCRAAEERGMLLEGFIEESGRVVHYRRYNAPRYPLNGRDSQDVLKESPTLLCDGVPYSLWYADLMEDVL